MSLNWDQEKRRELNLQLARIRQEGNNTKIKAAEHIKMVHESVADGRRDIEAKVAEQIEKLMDVYHKCNAEKKSMDVSRWQIENELKKMNIAMKHYAAKLEDLIQEAEGVMGRFATLKRDFDSLGIEASSMESATKRPVFAVEDLIDGDKKPAAVVMGVNHRSSNSKVVSSVTVSPNNPYAKKYVSVAVQSVEKEGTFNHTLENEFDDEGFVLELQQTEKKDKKDNGASANDLLIQASGAHPQ